jgi:hypothetical protein
LIDAGAIHLDAERLTNRVADACQGIVKCHVRISGGD